METEYAVRSRYLVAADGGKTVGRMLGIELEGPRRLRKMVNTYFSADLSPWIKDDGALIIYFINPDGHGQWAGGGLVKTGPRWDRHSETWVFMRELLPDDPDVIDDDNVKARIRELLRIPDLAIDVHMIGRWDVQGVVAKTYQSGRVFIAGDAAHRHPPVSALGLNTAFGDAHNLAWKLALVLDGKAPEQLLADLRKRAPAGRRARSRMGAQRLSHAQPDRRGDRAGAGADRAEPRRVRAALLGHTGRRHGARHPRRGHEHPAHRPAGPRHGDRLRL